MTDTVNRVPSGVPTGGQFAASAKAEADVTLAHSDAVAALGDLTADQQRLLSILLNPQNSAETGWSNDPEDIIEEFENFGSFDGYEAHSDAQHVADMLRAHYDRGPASAGDAGSFTYGYEATAEGEIGSYTVGTYLGHDHNGAYLIEAHETKYLANGDRSATGLKAALNYAEVIDGDYQRILNRARKAGLVPDPTRDLTKVRGELVRHLHGVANTEDAIARARRDADKVIAFLNERGIDLTPRQPEPPRKSAWPETDFERSVFADWQHEVANGDDPAGFRDWYEARYSAKNDKDEN